MATLCSKVLAALREPGQHARQRAAPPRAPQGRGLKHQVCIQDSGEHYACGEQKSLLLGMVALGKSGIPVGCRSGGCGVCKVQVLAGQVQTQVMSRAHVSAEEQAQGVVLACRASPCSDVTLSVIGQLRKRFKPPG
jgi:ferredoxin